MNDYKKYFIGEEEILEKLERLHEKQQQLKNIMVKEPLKKTFVVELLGLPRTGKTSCTDKIYDFFKMGGIKIEKADEPAMLIKRNHTKEEIDTWSRVKFNDETLNFSRKALEEKVKNNPSIILMDRGIIDNYIWYNMMLNDGTISSDVYNTKIKELNLDMSFVDRIYMMIADPEVIIKRDYMNEIWLEKRKKTNLETVKKLYSSIKYLEPILQKIGNHVNVIDTSNISGIDTSIEIADDIMDEIGKRLIKK